MRPTIVDRKKGNKRLVASSIDTLLTEHPTKSAAPTGGVVMPTQRLNIMMMPKCTGEIPSSVAIGKKMGVKINSAGVKSINMPTMSRIMFISNKMRNELWVIPNMVSDISFGS